MSERKEYKLNEIASIIDCEHKTAPLVQSSDFISVRTSNIANGKIDFENCNRVSKETYEMWTQRMIPEEGDIILAREAPVGEVGLIPSGKKVCLGQRTVLIRINNSSVSSKFLLYYLVNRETKYELVSRSTGSVVEHLNVKDIREFEIKIPESLSEQAAIAEVLSSLDDKIDLLHRQNKTLEQLAETLFRQWFVEEAEESWEIGTIDDVVSMKGGTTPSTNESKFWDGNVHWTSPRDLSNTTSIFLFDTSRKITEEGLKQISSGLLPIGTLLLSSRAPIGYLALTEIPVAINQGYIAIICNKIVSNYYMYLWCKANMETIENAGNGSVFQEISKSAFKTLEFQIPPKEKLSLFDEQVEPIFQKIKSNTIQIRTLTQMRDTLLPKLMSGEVKINFNEIATV